MSGFRENHPCHIPLTSLVDPWLSSINDNKFCGALFVDFAKAYDVIDYDLLLRKLVVSGLSPETLILLASFLTARKQTVHVNASTSKVRFLRYACLLYTSPSPRDWSASRMPSSA